MFNLPGWLFTVIALVLTLFVIGLIFARLYRRASAEQAFVRTGLGGQKVVMSGGAIVMPIFHETIPVNMNTLKLEVSRAAAESLITRDRMRVDVAVAFFLRVNHQPKEYLLQPRRWDNARSHLKICVVWSRINLLMPCGPRRPE